ncbi:MAG: sulfatase-like hydrolase/transferase, partial [Planctomycetota bacterium]
EFHAGAAICSPSRATLLTGRQHLRTGIYGVLQDQWHNMHLLEREVTIAEVLQQAGYGTAHFGKWHIGMTSGKRKKPSPAEHGFDYWFGLSNGAHPSHKNPVNFLRNGERVGPLKGYSCQLIVDDAIRWLDEKKKPDQPFFLNLWFNEPHHKLAAPDQIVSLYGDLKDEAAIYSATIDNTDRAIGRLVAKLKAMGKLDNTLIIYSSDHGSYRTDRNGGLKGNKGSNFQGGLRSPGIFFWPDGFRGGRVESTPSGSVDLLPTICGLTGIEKTHGVHLDGADLSPLLLENGKFRRDQPLLWLAPSSGHLATLRDGDYTLMGYRGYQLPFERDRYNEIVRRMAELSGVDPSLPNLGQRVSNTTFSSPEFNRLNFERVRLQTFQEAWIPAIKAGGFSRFALYDLSTDPLQKKDISKQRPEVTERLKKKLLALYKDVMADAPDWEPVEGVYSTATPTGSGTRQEFRQSRSALRDPKKIVHGAEGRATLGRLASDKTTTQNNEPKVLTTSATEDTAIEKKTRIHRLATTRRSVFDAFSYLNRIPDETDEGETPEDLAGRVFSRLANQEGRILLKTPPGMERSAYEGFKTFLRYEGTASVGNCSACHSLSDFRDGKSHIVTEGGKALPTPSLRNMSKREVDLQAALKMKLDASRLKKSGKASQI